MKRLFSFLMLVVLLGGVLAACAAPQATPTEAPEEAAEEEEAPLRPRLPQERFNRQN